MKNDILDFESTEIIDIKQESVLPLGLKIIAIVMMSLMIYVFASIFILLSFVILCILVFVILYSSGVQIDLNGGVIRGYNVYWGIKKGKWHSLLKYKALVVLHTTKSSSLHSRANVSSHFKERSYDIFLVDKNHWNKFYITKKTSKMEAQEFVKKLSEQLTIDVAQYSPKRISKRR